MNHLILFAVAGDAPGPLQSLSYAAIGLVFLFALLGLVWVFRASGVLTSWAGARRLPRAGGGEAKAPRPPRVDPCIPPEVVAVIAAAVHTSIKAGERIVAIHPVPAGWEQQSQLLAWAAEGRRQIFTSRERL